MDQIQPSDRDRPDQPTAPVGLTIPPGRAVRLLLAISLAFIAIDVAFQVVDDLVAPAIPGWETAAIILDADSEASLPTWWGIILLLLCALASAGAALTEFKHRLRRYWWSLATIFLLLSADEQAMVHEHLIVPLRDRFGLGGVLFYAWVAPALVAVAVLVVIYARFVFRQPPPVRNLLIVSATLFLSGALGLEMLGGWWTENRSDTELAYQMITSVEELLEFTGATLYVYAVLHLLHRRGSSLRFAVGDAHG